MEQLAHLPEKGIDVLQMHQMGDYLAIHGRKIRNICEAFARNTIFSTTQLIDSLANEHLRPFDQRINGNGYTTVGITYDISFLRNYYPDSIFKIKEQKIGSDDYRIYIEEHPDEDNIEKINFREFYFRSKKRDWVYSHGRQGIATREVLENDEQILSCEYMTYYPSTHLDYKYCPEGVIGLSYERI